MSLGPLTLLLFAVCLCLSFLFSGMEAGVFTLSRVRIRQQMRAGRISARLLHGYLEHPENFLWTILAGNTLVNFVVLGLVVVELRAALNEHRLWFTVVFLALVFLFYALCDLLPKTLFRLYPNRLCLALARPFRFVHLGLAPLVRLLEWCSRRLVRWTGGKAFRGELFGNREELRLFMQESAQTLTSDERAMIGRVLDLQTMSVGQIATPLAQAVTVSVETPVAALLAMCRERKLTRLPVWELRDGQPRIVGVVNVEALLFEGEPAAGRPLKDYLKPAVYLSERTRLEEALRQLQRSGQRLAIVLARDGREMGIVSLEDILKVIFGDVSL
jgi:CBS domain containing-hemolysin-like protein